ncbi:hypothetical protein [Streptomyces sp. NPDC005385]|uniref:hypothetical protein n=1 Tax=Streptomyces sp. NPDC005385 TaxID=3157039 RepID=UPI0033AA24AC
MTINELVPPTQRRRVLALVEANPGRRSSELEARCESALLKAWVGHALAELVRASIIRLDEHGGYWPTG